MWINAISYLSAYGHHKHKPTHHCIHLHPIT